MILCTSHIETLMRLMNSVRMTFRIDCYWNIFMIDAAVSNVTQKAMTKNYSFNNELGSKGSGAEIFH